MADVARLVGMELREYEKDGQKKQFCGLHLVYVEGSFEEVLGSRVEETSCPRAADFSVLQRGPGGSPGPFWEGECNTK